MTGVVENAATFTWSGQGEAAAARDHAATTTVGLLPRCSSSSRSRGRLLLSFFPFRPTAPCRVQPAEPAAPCSERPASPCQKWSSCLAYDAYCHSRPCTRPCGHSFPSVLRTLPFPRCRLPQPSSADLPCPVRTASFVTTDRAHALQVRHSSPFYFDALLLLSVLPVLVSTAVGT